MKTMGRMLPFIIAGTMAFTASAAPALAQDPDLLSVSAGAFDFDDYENEAAELRVEYRSGWKILGFEFGPVFRGIGPMVGLMANTDGGVFGYGGIYSDIQFGERVVLFPSVALGGYNEGDSRDLGGVFQFQLGLTAAYRFEDDSSLGITFAHISNASIHDKNPGVESLLLTYTISLGRLF